MVGSLEQQRAPGRLCRARSVRAAVSCFRGVREVVEEGGDVLLGLAVRACRCRRECSRGEVLGRWGRRGRAHLSPEEMRAVDEAASPM